MKIGVVIVTYNRLNKLKKALKAYESQNYKPEYIIIVDNNSNDGTDKFIKEWYEKQESFDKYIINLPENIGGSGGFYYGLNKALELNADWIWVSDDDAYPDENALLKINEYYKCIGNEERKSISALCCQIINNGKIDLGHRKRLVKGNRNIKISAVAEEEYNKPFELDLFSYVGTIINKSKLDKVGLPEKEYFIYYDDTEHSYRLSKSGKIICIPDAKVIHNVEVITSKNIDWKGYYSVRNKLLFIKKHFEERYYNYEYRRYKVKCLIRDLLRKEKIKNIQIKSALKDSKNDIKGLHEIYKPGWKINNI